MGHDTNATAAGADADALERLVRARMDAEIRGLHVPELIPTLEAAIMREPVPVSRGEVADAVDAAFALVARISLRGVG